MPKPPHEPPRKKPNQVPSKNIPKPKKQESFQTRTGWKRQGTEIVSQTKQHKNLLLMAQEFGIRVDANAHRGTIYKQIFDAAQAFKAEARTKFVEAIITAEMSNIELTLTGKPKATIREHAITNLKNSGVFPKNFEDSKKQN